MGHHINNEGKFQSDKYPSLGVDKIIISFKDRRTHKGLREIAEAYADSDPELTEDILRRLSDLKYN